MVTIANIPTDAVLNRLDAIKPFDWAALEALARDVQRELDDAPLMLARFWTARAGDERRLFSRMLDRLEEASVSAWLAAADQSKGESRLDALRHACSAVDAHRRRIAERLRGLLSRKAAYAPPPPGDDVEEKELPSRDCDEAWVALRRLLKTDESQHANIVARRRLLNLPEELRDAQIAEFASADRFTTIVEPDQ